MASSQKRCLYEVLGLSMDCSSDDIRSAYKRLALQRHPDKLVQSGLTPEEATASFQELLNAYQILSDSRERTWYDSHRSQVLFSNPDQSGTASSIPDLFHFFSDTVYSGYSDSKKGFYKVYSDVFDKVYSVEIAFTKKLGLGDVKEAPLMGNLESTSFQVRAFYDYWLGFSTVMDFCWVDQYDVMGGGNRKSRRVMEEENKKLRKRAKREYNETVRELAAFVKKRDKRVIEMLVKKKEEMERKKQKELERKKQKERERAEARAYQEPEWAVVDEEDINFETEEGGDDKKIENEEFYCVVCGKKFKSDKQWKNHEQSKKHKEKVERLRKSFKDDDARDNEARDGEEEEDFVSLGGSSNELDSKSDESDDLNEQFRDALEFEEVDIDEVVLDTETGGDVDVADGKNDEESCDSIDSEVVEEVESEDKGGEHSCLNSQVNHESTEVHEEIDGDDDENSMQYDGKRKTRRRRRSKTEREGNKDNKGSALDANGSSVASGREPKEDRQERLEKMKTSKGRKQKSSKKSGNTCDTCGGEFESKNKLHKHLQDTGHATLRSR